MLSGTGSSVPWYTIFMLTRFLHTLVGVGHDQRPELIDVIIALSPYDDSACPVVHIFVVDRYFSNGIGPIHFINPGYPLYSSWLQAIQHIRHPGES